MTKHEKEHLSQTTNNSQQQDSANELKAVFYYIAVNLRVLENSAPELRLNLLEEMPGTQIAGSLALYCSMAAEHLEPWLQKLEAVGKIDELFCLGLEDGMEFSIGIEPAESAVPTQIAPWLIGNRREGELWLSFCDG